MKACVELPKEALYILGILFFASCVLSALSFLRSAAKKVAAGLRPVAGIVFLVSSVFSLATEALCFYEKRNMPVCSPAIEIMSLPAAAVIPLCAVCFISSLGLFVYAEKKTGEVLSDRSLRDGLDGLSDGVLFSDSGGVPILVNMKMRDICYTAFGLTLLDFNYLKRRMNRNELRYGCSLTRRDGENFLHLPDGSVWQLHEARLETRFGEVTEFIAFDVTELYRGEEELRQRNERLLEVNRQIREFSSHIDAAVREKELLAAKIRVHDGFGKSLLAIRRYLSENDCGRTELLETLREPVFVISHDDGSASADSFELLEDAARAIGVKMYFDGEMPDENMNVLEVAIHECLTNTVKHASGRSLYIKSRLEGGIRVIELTNDGDPPKAPVKETGGLKNLRSLASGQGVDMEIRWQPAFRLTLKFKEGGNSSE